MSDLVPVYTTPANAQKLKRLLNMRFVGGGNIAVQSTPDVVTITDAGRRSGAMPSNPPTMFMAEILSHQALTNTNRWSYSYREVTVNFVEGPFGLDVPMVSVVVDGNSTETTGIKAYNLQELNNTTTGVQGNSIDISSLSFPQGFNLQPVGAGPLTDGDSANRVVVHMTIKSANNRKWAAFEYVNSVDGACG